MTNAQHLVAACGAMMLLVAIVGLRLLVVRVAEMRAKRLPMQAVSNSVKTAARLERVQASDNFRNLFELPVLFYALCAVLATAQHVSAFFIVGVWAYVALRYVHSFIHITYNRVMHRFAVYVLSTVVLFVLWAALAVQLLRG